MSERNSPFPLYPQVIYKGTLGETSFYALSEHHLCNPAVGFISFLVII